MNFLNNKIKSNTRKIFLLVFVVVLIIFMTFGSLSFLIYKKIAIIEKTIVDIQGEYMKDEKINLIKHLMRDTDKERIQLDKYFITKNMVVEFIETIEGIGEYAGIDFVLNSVDMSSGEDANFSMSISTKGDWNDTMYFLTLLESLPVYIEIDSVKFVKIDTPNKSQKTYWSGNFSIRLLSFTDIDL